MTKLTADEFQRRVEQNTNKFKRNYQYSADPVDYHLYDAERGTVRPMMLLDKVYDIFAAVSIGALAVLGRSGEDAVMLRGRRQIPIELKFVKIESSRYLVGRQGGIYLGGRKTRASLANTMQAQYTINSESHLETKNRYTIMVVYDQSTGMFVEARGIAGDLVLEKLRKQKTSRRLFYWDTFMKHGEQIPLVVPSLGYDGLVKLIQENNR